MAGISATLSKEDLQFMAEAIDRELMAFLPPQPNGWPTSVPTNGWPTSVPMSY